MRTSGLQIALVAANVAAVGLFAWYLSAGFVGRPVTKAPALTPTVVEPAAQPPVAVVVPGGKIPSSRSAEISGNLTWKISQAMTIANRDDREVVLRQSLPALLSLDPAAAGRTAESVMPGTARDEILQRVAQGWGPLDSAAAIDWATHLSDPGERQRGLADICRGIARTDPARAMETAERLAPGGNDGLIQDLAQSWAEKDVTSALTWVRRQPAGEKRDQAFSRIAFVEARAQPAKAAELLVEEIPEGSIQTEAAISVLHVWALQDADGAATWAEEFSAGPLRARAQRELAVLRQARQTANPAPLNP